MAKMTHGEHDGFIQDENEITEKKLQILVDQKYLPRMKEGAFVSLIRKDEYAIYVLSQKKKPFPVEVQKLLLRIILFHKMLSRCS